jgi:phospholipid/cholesterol/gamma-HCH transport system substrate-binding protein
MESKREQALVGFFVIVASALLIATILYLSGSLSSGLVPYHAYFKNAGGLTPGTEVRYAGGPPIGRVKKVAPDPKDPTRMEIDFSIEPNVPVKTDSRVEIASTSALGENYLGIRPGTAAAPHAPPNSTLPSKEYVSFADIGEMLSGLGPSAQQLVANLNDRVVELKVTLARVNDLLNDENRANISGSLSHIHGMLAENRPAIHSSLNHINDASAKLGPLLDDFRTTSAKANDLITHIDEVIGEDREGIRDSVAKLKQTLTKANELTAQLNNLMSANSENLDEIIDNLRAVSNNMREITETIKTRPYTLIRSSSPKPHEPGEGPPK